MTSWRRLRSDLSKPESPTRREELPFLIGAAVIIVVAAQLSDPGTPIELLLLAPAVVAFPVRGLVPRLPSEVFVAVVLTSVSAAQIVDGNLEFTFFLIVFAVLYAAWHLGSTTRAVVVLVVAAATPWITSVVIGPEEFAWVPWTLASVFISQTKTAPLVLPQRRPDGRWTVDAWAPLDGRVWNGGIRVEL